MIEALLDTATVVDLLREYSPAAKWFAESDKTFGVTKFVWIEIVEGCENKQALINAIRLLERFQLIPITIVDVDWALEKLMQLNLRACLLNQNYSGFRMKLQFVCIIPTPRVPSPLQWGGGVARRAAGVGTKIM